MLHKILILIVLFTLASSEVNDDINEDVINFLEGAGDEVQAETEDIPAMMNGSLQLKYKMMSNTQVTIFFSVAGGTFVLMLIFSFVAAMYDVGKTMKSGMKPRTHA